MGFPREEITKKSPLFFSPSMPPPKRRKYRKTWWQSTSYKFMGGIESSDMMLNTYWNERRKWKKVAFNIIGRILLNS
jgi:hypothetical protein